MSISISKNVPPSVEPGSEPSKPAKTAPPPRKAVFASERSSVKQAASVQPDVSSPAVTFRRDANGQIYYVLSDPQSGKELRELPPAEIRKVGEGIANFLKQDEQKHPHLEVKA